MGDSGPNCQAPAAYWLEVTTPGTPGSTVISGTPTSRMLNSYPAGGSTCEVTVTFGGLRQVPTTASLDIDQAGKSSTIALTVSRSVGLAYYLLIPALAGFLMAAVMFVAALFLVRLYRRNGCPLRFSDPTFWTRPISASGAWTVNDSWATNITALVVLLGTVLGVTTATGTLFPGVAVDRFVIMNIIAGAIVALAPLVFGVLYAGWTKRNPGVMADATLTLPRASRAKLAGSVVAVVARGTAVTIPGNHHASLAADTPLILEPGPDVLLPGGGTIQLAEASDVMLRPYSCAIRPTGQPVRLRWWTPLPISGADPVVFPAGARVRLREPAEAELTGDGSVVLLHEVRQAELLSRTPVSAPHASKAKRLLGAATGHVPAGTQVVIRTGTAVTLRPMTTSLISNEPVILPDGAAAREFGLRIDSGAAAILMEEVTVGLGEVGMPLGAIIEVPSGASVVVPGGATLRGHGDGGLEPVAVQVKPGCTIQVPTGASISVLPGATIAVPGGTDIGVRGQSTMKITGDIGPLTIAAADIVPPHNVQAHDAQLRSPVRITTSSGAKVSAVGVMDVLLPQGTCSSAPYRREFALPRERNLQIPQGSNVIFGAMYIVLIAAVVTMFGIGAELGIAGVLAYGLSEASQAWRSFMLGVTGLLAVLILVYAVTAIRALADPRPGSSISATGGTSFTL